MTDFRPDLDLYKGAPGDVAEYATPERSRVDSGAYNVDRGLPWHVAMSRQLGTRELMAGHDGTMTIEEALELGGLNWSVELKKLQVIGGGKASRTVQGYFATTRSDTGDVLGVVGRTYKPLQNAGALSFGDAILDAGGAIVETVFSLKGGRIVGATLELPKSIRIGGLPSEEIRVFLVIVNSHDGSRAVRAMLTPIRVVCANTENMAWAHAKAVFAVRHTGRVEGRILEARRVLDLSFEALDHFQAEAETLLSKKLVDSQVRSILEAAFPIMDGATDRERENSIAEGIIQNWKTSENLEEIRGTAWGVLNAATEWTDHVRPVRQGQYGKDDVRAYSVLFGSAIETKEKVLAALREA